MDPWDAWIRSRTGAEVKQGLFSYKSFLYTVGSLFCFGSMSGFHTGPVWTGSKQEKIQSGSAPVCTVALD